jgi:NAD(P)-dependent dehydrogenase (short-subunit alcohol dehydrogenase family)
MRGDRIGSPLAARSGTAARRQEMQNLRGKVAVVTGAASGIGRAMAEVFAAEGARVVLADIEEAPLAAAAKELETAGAEALAVPTDVTKAQALIDLAEAAEARFGTTHILCNNAGVAPIAPMLETTLEDWRWVFEVNLFGVVHGIQAFAPRLVAQGEGHIVNTASSGGLLTVPGFGAYCATKHAVVGLSETLYQELSGTGVGVSVLCPGLIATKIFESERNRPADGGPTEYGKVGEGARKSINETGSSPEHVAHKVVEAIREGRMHILPNEEIVPVVAERFRRILEGENPMVIPSFEE